ncbi:GNAT family N-acetyltransferase [Haloglomus litoreum]|uniref:GNAT family N-acetyltransferase n=1 Tax=Haloglomus litoreum TaxID=3034026 RepID=UPI0023E8A474|nr:N-acetyltransferase [Haloglomus sp. DT116]
MTSPTVGPDPDPAVRPYDPARDADALWAGKRAFELGLGEAGDTEKEAAYAGKLTDDYREDWLAWVRRCVETDPGCVLVAVPERSAERGPPLAGYAFLLPERLAFVWDAAVLNELWVAPRNRGTGLADDLFEGVLAHARGQELPLDRLLLDVDAENERARAFYERHGFTGWGELVARDL